MKVGKFEVRRKYTLPQVICDIFSMIMLFIIFQVFINQYQLFANKIPIYVNADNEPVLFGSKMVLFIFPTLSLVICLASVILCFRTLKQPINYHITKNTASNYFNILVTSIGLVRCVLLLAMFELLYYQCEFGNGRNPGIKMQLIMDIIIIMIIVRFTRHRLRKYKL